MKSKLVYHQKSVQAYLAHKGKRLYYNTFVKVPPTALDKNNFVKANYVDYASKLNETIMLKKAEFDEAILKDLKANGFVDLSRVKDILYNVLPDAPVVIDKSNVTFDEVLTQFTSSLIKMNRGLKWRYNLLHKILHKERKLVKDVTVKDVARYFETFIAGINANTAGTRLKNFRKFYKWAREEGYSLPRVNWDELSPKTFKPDFVYLDSTKLQQLEAFVAPTPHLQRVKEIFLTLCHTAMRYSEYHSLQPDEVVIKGDEMYVDKVSIKTKTRFIVPVTNQNVQRILKNPPKMAEAVFNRSVKVLGEKIGWKESVRFRIDTSKYETDFFYKFLCSSVGRHTAATDWAMKGLSEYDAMQFAGWNNPSMYRYYQNRLDSTNSFKKMKALHDTKEEPLMKIA